MAKQIINIGSGQNEGDGGPIRLAFEKINSNFDELYDGTVQTLTLVGTTLSISGGNQVTLDNVFEGGLTADVTGSVFGDDSTVLVDGVNNKIVGAVDTTSLRTSEGNIALGTSAGFTNQGAYGIALGFGAGDTNQGPGAISIGYTAGQTTQGNSAIAIGPNAGNTTQGIDAVAIGVQAGLTTQGQSSVAIGQDAGQETQGAESVAIGKGAGTTNQAANSIVINATGIALQNTTASSLVIKPIRSAVGTTMLMYDATTGEVTHTASPVITGDITGSVFADDSTILVDGVSGTIPYPAHAGVSWDGLRPETVADALDRLAAYTQDFAVSTDAHWADPDPTGITDAINRLAAAIYALNGNTGI